MKLILILFVQIFTHKLLGEEDIDTLQNYHLLVASAVELGVVFM